MRHDDQDLVMAVENEVRGDVRKSEDHKPLHLHLLGYLHCVASGSEGRIH